MTKILFVLKKRERFDSSKDLYVGLSSGLYNSVKFLFDMALKNIEMKISVLNDNNDIDREVGLFKPDFVIIEALWVVPEKFEILHQLHPKVKWIVRLHSELPFIACEGIAMDWVGKYLTYVNVSVACNAPRILNEMKFFASCISGLKESSDVVYLPNYYPVNRLKQKSTYFNKSNTLNIACFGAIRPLKNHLIQALAAIQFATRNNKKINFHINSDRLEMNGEPALRNLVGLFENIKDKGHKLIHHPWCEHTEFKKLCSTMDIGMQVSFTETFNIVSADLISEGVPIISTSELPWIASCAICDPTNSEDIVEKLELLYRNPLMNVMRNQSSLEAYVKKTKKIWAEYFEHKNNNRCLKSCSCV